MFPVYFVFYENYTILKTQIYSKYTTLLLRRSLSTCKRHSKRT